ncbi:dipeptide epimerase [Aeoliella sp.]|uniref:dipeptide epimerase n=1 Tax=Aeoliella sp. TaxID=2795800 RepID=UPI003CCBAA9E
MKVSLHERTAPLKKPFTISRGTLTEQPVLIVKMEQDGNVGYGETTANDYYGHTLESIRQSIESVQPQIEQLDIVQGDEVYNSVAAQLAGDMFALSALDIACQDLAARRAGKTCFENWGLEWTGLPESSLTIGINDTPAMVADLKENPGWNNYKVKLGTTRDIEIVSALRGATDAKLRIDANCAWTADETIEKSKQLADLGVEFIEQPLPPDAPRDDFKKVYEGSALPVIADESCQIPAHVEPCGEVFHGINVKLCKCGGLTPAVQMLKQARQMGLKTMVGCMVETSIGISAASQLLPLLNFADLDGAILLGNDPATGVKVELGKVNLADSPGTGAVLRD